MPAGRQRAGWAFPEHWPTRLLVSLGRSTSSWLASLRVWIPCRSAYATSKPRIAAIFPEDYIFAMSDTITTGRRLAGGANRQANHHPRPLSRLAVGLDRPLVRLDNGANQAQSQAQTPLRLAGPAAVGPVPDPGKFLGLDPHPCVFHRDQGLFLLRARFDLDASPGRGVLDGVVQHVGDRLADPFGISPQTKPRGQLGPDGDFLLLRHVFVEPDHARQIGRASCRERV